MTKPRLKYSEAFPALDFEWMKMGTQLKLDGQLVKFAGEHFGHVWIKVKGKVRFLRKGDPAIADLRRC